MALEFYLLFWRKRAAKPRPQAVRGRPVLEALEDRALLSHGLGVKNPLVANTKPAAPHKTIVTTVLPTTSGRKQTAPKTADTGADNHRQKGYPVPPGVVKGGDIGIGPQQPPVPVVLPPGGTSTTTISNGTTVSGGTTLPPIV